MIRHSFRTLSILFATEGVGMSRKRKTLLILSLCVVLAAAIIAAVLFTRVMNSGEMISQLSESDDLSAGSAISEDDHIDIFDHVVPLGEEYGEINPFITELIELVNAERAKVGVGALVVTAELYAAALKRAEELSVDFSHYRPDGSVCFTVFSEFGISSSARAENIAGNFRSPEQVFHAWMESEGHRNNIMNASYTKLGAGIFTDSDGKFYWVQLFAR